MKNKIILGTAQFGMNYGISNSKGKINFIEIIKILDLLKKKKLNFLDTASSYDLSESEIGKYYLKSKKKFNIITKYTLKNKGDIFKQYEDSIKNLKYKPKVIMAHSYKDYLDKNFRTSLFKLKKKFKISKIGVSIYNKPELYSIIKLKTPNIIQVPCNILDKRFISKDVVELVNKKKIEIHARSIFLQGLLFKSKRDIIKKFKDAKDVIKKLEKLCIKHNLKLWELSLIWAYQKKEIKKLIIGVDTQKQLQKNLRTIKKKINTSLIKEIEKINLNNSKIIKPYLWKKK